MKDERVKMKIASKREQRELVHYAEREQLKACVAGLKKKETLCSYTPACRVAVALLPFFAFFIIFAPLNIC